MEKDRTTTDPVGKCKMEKDRTTTDPVEKCVCTVSALIQVALPISMIVMGALYLDDCPAQRYIPIYLIVTGCFAVILVFFLVMGNYMVDAEYKQLNAILHLSEITSLIVLTWFIAGNVWIYGLHGKYSINPMDSNYCNNTFYLYAFWVTFASYLYILLGIIVVLNIICQFGVC